MSILKSKKKEKSVLLPVGELMPNPLQPRRRFDMAELKSLSESIRLYGVIQPLAVKKIESLPFPMPRADAKYEIIAGERRWRGAKMAGLTHVPCVVFDADRSESAMMALIENVQRCDLSYFEEALAMQSLLLMTGKTQTELAHSLSVSQSTLSNKIRLLRLSERERLMAMENGFSERHCRALVRLDSERERRPVMLAIIKDNLSAPETEKMIEELLTGVSHPQSETKPKKKKARVRGCIKDIRIFYNTIDKALKTLEASGYNASRRINEGEDGWEIVITLCPKGEKAKNAVKSPIVKP